MFKRWALQTWPARCLKAWRHQSLQLDTSDGKVLLPVCFPASQLQTLTHGYGDLLAEIQQQCEHPSKIGTPCVQAETMQGRLHHHWCTSSVQEHVRPPTCLIEAGQVRLPAGPCHWLAINVPLGSQPGPAVLHSRHEEPACTAAEQGASEHALASSDSQARPQQSPHAPGFVTAPCTCTPSQATQRSSRHRAYACAPKERGLGPHAPALGRNSQARQDRPPNAPHSIAQPRGAAFTRAMHAQLKGREPGFMHLSQAGTGCPGQLSRIDHPLRFTPVVRPDKQQNVGLCTRS